MSDALRSPGWYPDPDGTVGESTERWWNGVGWSDSRRAVGGASSPIPAPPAPPAPAGAPAPPAMPHVVYSAENPAPQSPTDVAAAAQATARSLNTPATVGFVLAVVSIFVDFLIVPSIIAVVLGFRGLARARQLAELGEARTHRTTAILAIVIGAASAIWSGTWFVVGLLGS